VHEVVFLAALSIAAVDMPLHAIADGVGRNKQIPRAFSRRGTTVEGNHLNNGVVITILSSKPPLIHETL
jgi:hypothetical protein